MLLLTSAKASTEPTLEASDTMDVRLAGRVTDRLPTELPVRGGGIRPAEPETLSSAEPLTDSSSCKEVIQFSR